MIHVLLPVVIPAFYSGPKEIHNQINFSVSELVTTSTVLFLCAPCMQNKNWNNNDHFNSGPSTTGLRPLSFCTELCGDLMNCNFFALQYAPLNSQTVNLDPSGPRAVARFT